MEGSHSQQEGAKQKIVDDLSAFGEYHRKGDSFSVIETFAVKNARVLQADDNNSDLSTPFFHVPYMREAGLSTRDADIHMTNEPTSNDNLATEEQPKQSVSGLPTQNATVSPIDISLQLFYQRNDVSKLWEAIDALTGTGKTNTLWVRGQPGTGKSTSIWKKLLVLANTRKELNALWISLDRKGNPLSAVYFQGRCFYQILLTKAKIRIFLAAAANFILPLDLVVVDGINQAVSSDLVGAVDEWLAHDPNKTRKAIYSSSSKVEELRSHQNQSTQYITVQSWTLTEFQSACIHIIHSQDNGGTLALTQFGRQISGALEEFFPDDCTMTADPESVSGNKSGNISEDEEADDSDASMSERTEGERPAAAAGQEVGLVVLDLNDAQKLKSAIAGKFRWSGGSARFMFNYSKKKIEKALRDYCIEAKNRKALLAGEIGPTSEASTNYFFGSSLREDHRTEYFLVSQEAARILSESIDRTNFDILYSTADRLENPAFVGWIVEADFFFQLNAAIKHKIPFNPPFSNIQPSVVLPYDHTKCHRLLVAANGTWTRKKNLRKKLETIKSIASKFVPKSKGTAIACKPVRWSQGGYDMFLVQLAPKGENCIDVRFAQVTKGKTHDLKAGFLYTVLKFFEKAGYTINEVEIAFVLTPMNCTDFAVEGVEAHNALQEYSVYVGGGAKWNTISDGTVQKYTLTLSKTDFSA